MEPGEMEEVKITPAWRVASVAPTYPKVFIEDAAGNVVCRCETPEQASLIVQRCNAHDELVGALRQCTDRRLTRESIEHIARAALAKAGVEA
jgi:hypothetical protein